MQDLGAPKYFMELGVARSPQDIYLCQRKYTLEIITECGLLGCKNAGSPMDQNHKLSLAQSDLLTDSECYRRLTGHLIYLLPTRPDLAYSVHILTQFMQQSHEENWLAALKTLRYLKGSIRQCVPFGVNTMFSVTGWCDADWGACPIRTRKHSLTCWIIQFGTSPIAWKTKKQDDVSFFSTKEEFREMKAIKKSLFS